jgi:hypothetical protein
MHPNYRPALELAQQKLRSMDPEEVARRSGAAFAPGGSSGEFRLPILGKEYRIPYPDYVVYDGTTGRQAGVSPTLIGLHYLVTSDGSSPRGEWIPYRALPGGNVYQAAFRRRSVDIILGRFASDAEGFRRSAEAMGGTPANMGDASFVIDALPKLPMACVLWLGDDEQPAEASVLFDAGAPSHLHTEDLAALSTMLALGLVWSRETGP